MLLGRYVFRYSTHVDTLLAYMQDFAIFGAMSDDDYQKVVTGAQQAPEPKSSKGELNSLLAEEHGLRIAVEALESNDADRSAIHRLKMLRLRLRDRISAFEDKYIDDIQPPTIQNSKPQADPLLPVVIPEGLRGDGESAYSYRPPPFKLPDLWASKTKQSMFAIGKVIETLESYQTKDADLLIESLKNVQRELDQFRQAHSNNAIKEKEYNEKNAFELGNKERRNAHLSARIPSSLKLEMKRAAKAQGMSQEDWLINQLAAATGARVEIADGKTVETKVPFAGPSSSERIKKEPVTLRLEPPLLDALNQALSGSGAKRNDWIRASIVKSLKEGLDVRGTLTVVDAALEATSEPEEPK